MFIGIFMVLYIKYGKQSNLAIKFIFPLEKNQKKFPQGDFKSGFCPYFIRVSENQDKDALREKYRITKKEVKCEIKSL